MGTGFDAVEAGRMQLAWKGPSRKPRVLLSAAIPEARGLGELSLRWGWHPVTCL